MSEKKLRLGPTRTVTLSMTNVILNLGWFLITTGISLGVASLGFDELKMVVAMKMMFITMGATGALLVSIVYFFNHKEEEEDEENKEEEEVK